MKAETGKPRCVQMTSGKFRPYLCGLRASVKEGGLLYCKTHGRMRLRGTVKAAEEAVLLAVRRGEPVTEAMRDWLLSADRALAAVEQEATK